MSERPASRHLPSTTGRTRRSAPPATPRVLRLLHQPDRGKAGQLEPLSGAPRSAWPPSSWRSPGRCSARWPTRAAQQTVNRRPHPSLRRGQGPSVGHRAAVRVPVAGAYPGGAGDDRLRALARLLQLAAAKARAAGSRGALVRLELGDRLRRPDERCHSGWRVLLAAVLRRTVGGHVPSRSEATSSKHGRSTQSCRADMSRDVGWPKAGSHLLRFIWMNV